MVIMCLSNNDVTRQTILLFWVMNRRTCKDNIWRNYRTYMFLKCHMSRIVTSCKVVFLLAKLCWRVLCYIMLFVTIQPFTHFYLIGPPSTINPLPLTSTVYVSDYCGGKYLLKSPKSIIISFLCSILRS